MPPLLPLLLLLPLLAALPLEERVDCQPAGEEQEELCSARGCLWEPAGSAGGGAVTLPPCPGGRAPSCFFPPSYGFLAEGEAEVTGQGATVTLHSNMVRLDVITRPARSFVCAGSQWCCTGRRSSVRRRLAQSHCDGGGSD